MNKTSGAGFPVITIPCPWVTTEDLWVAYSVYEVEDFSSGETDLEVTAQYIYYKTVDIAAILNEAQIYAIEVAIYKQLKGK